MKTLRICLVLACCVSGVARACSCQGQPPVEVEVDRSEAVFTGVVTKLSLAKRESNGHGYGIVVCEFAVTGGFKGAAKNEKTITVVTNLEGSACGFPFEIGQEYLVYASSWHGELETNICRRTKPLISSRPMIYEPVIDDSGKKEAVTVQRLLKKEEPNQASEPTAQSGRGSS